MKEYPPPPPTKRCPKCERDLPLAKFSKCKRRKDGVQTYGGYCLECTNAYNRAYFQENYDVLRPYRTSWMAENRSVKQLQESMRMAKKLEILQDAVRSQRRCAS